LVCLDQTLQIVERPIGNNNPCLISSKGTFHRKEFFTDVASHYTFEVEEDYLVDAGFAAVRIGVDDRAISLLRNGFSQC